MSPESSGAGRRRPHRSKARAWALHVLYAWESGGEEREALEVLDDVLARRRVAPERKTYLRRLVEGFAGHRDDVDAALQDALENWRIGRLAALDRTILRIAATEMLFFPDVPPKTSIQEAIYLAERYGADDSVRFVNGVLDALLKESEVSS